MGGHEKPRVHPLVELARDIAKQFVGIAGGVIWFYGIWLMTPMGGALIPLGIVVALIGGAIMVAMTDTSFVSKSDGPKDTQSDKKE